MRPVRSKFKLWLNIAHIVIVIAIPSGWVPEDQGNHPISTDSKRTPGEIKIVIVNEYKSSYVIVIVI